MIAFLVPSPLSNDASKLQRPLEQFRAKTKRLRLHPLETTLLCLVATHLVFLSWAIGGMHLWSQWVSLGFGVVGFVLALVPRNYTEDYTAGIKFRLVPWPRLARFPLFWTGLALLGYVLIQTLNPAWTYQTDGKGWWMQAVPHTLWLPAGVDVPFESWGPWRKLILYTCVWLTVCTMWVAFTRRRTLQLFMIAMAVNGLLLAGFGIVQRLLGNGKLFWFWTSPNAAFFSSFVYKNHAGVYLDLTLATTCGLAAWYYLRGWRRLEKSNPSGVFTFFATCIAVSVLTSYARGASIVMLAFLLICVAAFIIHQLIIPNENRKPAVAIVLIFIFGFFLKTGLEAVRSGEAWVRLKNGLTNVDPSLRYREYATRAAIEMLGDTWKLGSGTGSFSYLFPTYQHRHPNLVATGTGQLMFWEHAHNDIVEIPIELGVIGTALVVASACWLLFSLAKNYFWTKPFSGCVSLGLFLVFAHSWFDFPFQCPAILILWWVLAVGATQWAFFEELNARD